MKLIIAVINDILIFVSSPLILWAIHQGTNPATLMHINLAVLAVLRFTAQIEKRLDDRDKDKKDD